MADISGVHNYKLVFKPKILKQPRFGPRYWPNVIELWIPFPLGSGYSVIVPTPAAKRKLTLKMRGHPRIGGA